MKTNKKQIKAGGNPAYKDSGYNYKLLSDFINNIPDVIYVKDKKTRLVMVNEAHARGLGLKPEQVVGMTDFDIFPKERAQAMYEDDMRVIKGGKPIIDKVERATRPDGIDNYVSTTKMPRYDAKGRIIGLIGITRDITHRMQLEHLREEKVRISKKLEALEELDKMKSDFVSVVSHELRTPLAIIKEAVSLIDEGLAGEVNDKQKGLLAKAMNNVKRLNNIIEGLLDISRIETGKIKLHYSLVNLNDLLTDSSTFFKNLAQQKNIHLKYNLPAQQINIFIDAERTNQVITNLINNAIKYTEENGKIKVEVKILETKVRMGVIDTGIGISKQDLPKLFGKFMQVSKIPGAEKEGLGLGLAITKDLVKLQDGEIWVESKLGVGSKFYFTLPRFYTAMVLDEQIRDRINDLLYKGRTLYLINLLIINFKEFKKKTKLFAAKKLFADLKVIIEATLNESREADKKKPQVVLSDYRLGECSIIFVDATDKESDRLCQLLKDKINNYFIKNKIENVFINIGILAYPSAGPLVTTQQLLANLYLKKIYIGSEIRRFKRVQYKEDIEIIPAEEKSRLSQAVDISEGGICFISERKLETDAKISIGLKLPKHKEPLYIKAQVAWIKNTEELSKKGANIYKVGLEFTKLKNKDRKILSNFIKSLSVPRSA